MNRFIGKRFISSFRLLDMPDKLFPNLVRSRILIPTEIQSKAFAPLKNLKSAVLMAETGSGKTLAYLLPTVARILERKIAGPVDKLEGEWKISALVIAPTPQLAAQSHNFLLNLTTCPTNESDSDERNVKCHLLNTTSTSGLKVPKDTDILTTTIPVLTSLFHLKDQLFSTTETVIVDEADWILGDSFPVDMSNSTSSNKNKKISARDIIDALKRMRLSTPDSSERQRKQFIFVGATMPPGKKSPRGIISDMFHDIQFIYSSGAHQTVPQLKQHWISIEGKEKSDILESKERELLNIVREIGLDKSEKILIFGNTVESIEFAHDSISTFLKGNDNLSARIRVDKLHSKLSKVEKEKVLSQFLKISEMDHRNAPNDEKINDNDDAKQVSTHILISGDSVARGYDFDTVSKVIQFDFASNVISHVHRVGRTARAGKQGEVINFVTCFDNVLADHLRDEPRNDIYSFEDLYKTNIARVFSRNKSLRKRRRKQPKMINSEELAVGKTEDDK